MKTDTELTPAQLRELDAWIAEHLFGTTITDDYSKVGEPNHAYRPWIGVSGTVPRYTTDPAAAMQVLEKCADDTSITITRDADGQFSVEWWADEVKGVEPIPGSKWHQIKTAPTLPLAICLFARELFKEESK